jgi:hypothetical protein
MAKKLNFFTLKKTLMTLNDQNEIIWKAACSDLARLMQPAGSVFDTPGVDV